MIISEPDLRLADPFLDQERLKAGEKWYGELQRELDLSEIFFFLISFNSLNSDFCVKNELAVAVSRKKHIIPVLLQDAGEWRGFPAGTDGEGNDRQLGSFGVLPKDDRFDLRPVDRFGKRSEAWSSVTRSVVAALRGQQGTRSVDRPRTDSQQLTGLSAPALLPYLCDRSDPITRFVEKQRLQGERALLLLLKGIPDDKACKFWERLVFEYLPNEAGSQGVPTGPIRPLVDLPSPEYVVENPADTERLVLRSLLTSLVKARLSTRDPVVADLEHALQGSAGLVPLYATLDPCSRARKERRVRALVDCIEKCASTPALGHLAVCIAVERPDMLGMSLAEQWEIQGHKNTLVIELGPLPQVSSFDVRDWHLRRQIEERYGVYEEQIMNAVGDKPLRMAAFRDRVAPLLHINR